MPETGPAIYESGFSFEGARISRFIRLYRALSSIVERATFPARESATVFSEDALLLQYFDLGLPQLAASHTSASYTPLSLSIFI